ncbi:hypothetical protein MKW98_024451 [Papaver atlanticum]|uniref:Uncharacterized protein n=1 Tax=Papaver atlanticum TaxID=357466 RepID=A0AAD4XLM9_9MAGN|nr:hypothetical protein MKW98_024451 [Papaver atlanticum]
MFCTLFFTNFNSTYVHYKYLNCVQSVDRMNMISWPDKIHEHMMESIASVTRNKSKTHTLTGCTVYLLLWFLGHVRNIKRKPDTNKLPRFARWNLYDGSSELEGMLEILSKEQVSENFVVAFTDEEKKMCTFEESEVQTLKAKVQELKNKVKVKDKIILDLKGEIEALKSQVEMLRENSAPRTPLHGGSPLPIVIYTPPSFNLNVTQEMNKVVPPEEPAVGNIQVDHVSEEPVAEVPVVEEPINVVPLATTNNIGSIVRNVKFTYVTRRKKEFDGFVTGEQKKQKTEAKLKKLDKRNKLWHDYSTKVTKKNEVKLIKEYYRYAKLCDYVWKCIEGDFIRFITGEYIQQMLFNQSVANEIIEFKMRK